MSRSLGVLTLDLIAKTSGFVEGLSKAERASAKSKKQFEKDLNDLKRNISIASAAFVAGATAMIGTSIKLADESRKTAQSIGLTTEALTGLRWAASQSGVSNEELTASFRRFSQSINDASNNMGKGKEVFDALNISIMNTDGTLKDSETLFYETANALAAMDDGLQKTAFASELLGRSGSKLIPLLNSGEEGIKKLTDEAARLGLVISDETGRNAEIFNDSLAVMASTARGTANVIVANFIPIMGEAAAALADSTKESGLAIEAGQLLTEIFKEVAKVGIGVAYAFETVGQRMARAVAIAASAPDGFSAMRTAAREATKEIEQTTLQYDELLKRIEQIGTETGSAQGSKGASTGVVAPFAAQETITPEQNRQDDLTTLEDSFKTELELLQEKHRQEQELLSEARAQQLETTRSYDELELMLAERQKAQLAALDEEAYREKLSLTQNALSNLSTLMNTESRKAFEVGKAAALANAIVSGYDSAVLAYEGGLKISGGNPAVGAAFAATAIAATGAHIQAIMSTKFGGGGGGAGRGASNTQAVNNASQGVTPPQQQGQDRNIFIRGINKDSLYSGEQLLDLLNNELANGGRIIANG